MILIDTNHLVIEACSGSLTRMRKIEPKLVRHIFMNRLAKIVGQNKKEFGQPVFCLEGGGYKRREIFKEYKGQREEGRADSQFDWDLVFHMVDVIVEECRAYFNYPSLRLRKYEADDMIAHIVSNDPSKHLIVARDGDFVQLQRFGNVEQLDAIKKERKTLPEGMTFNMMLLTDIVKGQRKDGVPSCFSDDSDIIEKVRQPQIRANYLEALESKVVDVLHISMSDLAQLILDLPEFKTIVTKRDINHSTLTRNLKRNRDCLILGEEKDEELDEYINQVLNEEGGKKPEPMKMMAYASENRLVELSTQLNNFIW